MKVYNISFSELLGQETGPYKAFYPSSGYPETASYLTVYAPEAWGNPPLALHSNRPAVVLFPGGGYHLSYEGEGEPVALKLCAAGACVFEVRYSVVDLFNFKGEPLFPQPLIEALAAVYYVRLRAETFGIDPHNISVMGFSAGGHVAAMAGTLWNKAVSAPYEKDLQELYRPDKMILCYPVLSSGRFSHKESFRFLMGDGATDEALESVSIEKQADALTPPTFLWHCMDDGCVPPQNSLLLQQRLRELGVLCEAHYYPRGGHGGSLGNYLVDDSRADGCAFSSWIDAAIRFMLN